jgi:hypothetical protein
MRYTEALLAVFVLVLVTFIGVLRGARGSVGRAASAAEPLAGVAPLDVLFYAALAFAMPLRHADWIMVILAWIYVLVRVFDVAGLWSGGRQPYGGLVGALVLAIMWVYFAVTFLVPLQV